MIREIPFIASTWAFRIRKNDIMFAFGSGSGQDDFLTDPNTPNDRPHPIYVQVIIWNILTHIRWCPDHTD